ELTAFLISAAPDLRVLTTSRAPLAIAAERVYLLGELRMGDAAQLFRERAVAARPSVRLTEQAGARIVIRLDLLHAGQQRALRRLALFHDGFTLDAAETVLGASAFDAVRGLVDQSLLSVREDPAGIRYRMLETVREFGRMQLAAAGEDASARAAQRRWAAGY